MDAHPDADQVSTRMGRLLLIFPLHPLKSMGYDFHTVPVHVPQHFMVRESLLLSREIFDLYGDRLSAAISHLASYLIMLSKYLPPIDLSSPAFWHTLHFSDL
jgi:hypothetical protein